MISSKIIEKRLKTLLNEISGDHDFLIAIPLIVQKNKNRRKLIKFIKDRGSEITMDQVSYFAIMLGEPSDDYVEEDE